MAGTSLRKVARELGVTAPALYAHVDDREDVLRSVADDALQELARRFDEIDVGDPIAQIRAQCEAYVRFAIENPDLFSTMFVFPPELQVAESLGIESAGATATFERALKTIDNAVAAGAIPAPDDTLVAALAMWSAMHGLAAVLTMGFGFDDATQTKVIDQAISAVVAGLLHPN